MPGVAHREQRRNVAGTQDLPGLPPRHNHGRLTRNQDDGVDVRALPVRVVWRQPARVLAASRYDWPPLS